MVLGNSGIGEKDKKGMSKRKKYQRNKTKKQQILNYKNNSISQEQMIEIHAEAYYRALKRIEHEKVDCVEEDMVQKQSKWYMTSFYINALLWPFWISKRFRLKNGICESLVVLLVSVVMKGVGCFVWIIGILTIIKGMAHIPSPGAVIYLVILFLVGAALICYGSILALVGREFEKEKDSNKIYAFSSFVLALISCAIGVIACFKQ